MLTKETIIKFIERKTSEKEQKEVLDWLESSHENRKEFARLKNMSVAVDIIAMESGNSTGKCKTRHSFTFYSLRIAAVLVVAVAMFLFGQRFQQHRWEKIAATQFTEITAPNGEPLHFALPDGSNVVLNGGSTLKFSKIFNEQFRDVYLSGEGYFEVKKGEKQFNVVYPIESPVFKLTVRGTCFNVSSYEDNEDIVTTLYEGAIQIENLNTKKSFQLDTNSRHIYKKRTGVSKIEPYAESYRWTDKYVSTNGEDISVLAKRLEQIFDVKISVDERLVGKCSYTGTLYGGSLQQILDNMTYVSSIKYSIQDNGKRIIIKQK